MIEDTEPPSDVESEGAFPKRSTYGTSTSQPDAKAGVEVGGGDKAAAALSKRARDEGKADVEPNGPTPEDPEEAQSTT